MAGASRRFSEFIGWMEMSEFVDLKESMLHNRKNEGKRC